MLNLKERSIEESREMAGPLFCWLWRLTREEAVKIDPHFACGSKRGYDNDE